ncbi:MAG: TetR family transcriptional regulator [Ruminococcus sp.]|nr:TetR family transcriptional regulator [Ruminococcus sp.]
MYTGRNRSALLSQKMISEAMLRLLEEKSFQDISISDLCREAQVSRQTFYTLFGSKENVITYELQNSCQYTPEGTDNESRARAFKDFCREYSKYIIEKKHIIGLLVKNDMMHSLYDIQYRTLMDCSNFIEDVSGDYRIFLIDFISSGMNSIARDFIQTGSSLDEETLSCLMLNLFSGHFFIEK